MIDWKRLVEERNEWVAKNFDKGDEFPGSEVQVDTVLGCVEEIGELTHAHLKESQGIRGTKEQHEENAKDAIGDLTIYLLGVMAKVGTPRGRGAYTVNTSPTWTLLKLAKEVGQLCQYQTIHHVDTIAALCLGYCTLRDWDYEEIVLKTWENVKQRDWKANSHDGGDLARKLGDSPEQRIMDEA